MEASKAISSKSLRNTGHGDKIKGQRFIILVKNIKKYDKFACFWGLRFYTYFLRIFGGPGELKIRDFLTFFAFFVIQISKPFFGRPKIRFFKKVL